MKVCVSALPDRLSHAMHRVARALEESAPDEVEIVSRPQNADHQILHTIDGGQGAYRVLNAPRYSVIQYCLKTANGRNNTTDKFWHEADMVWSYYPMDDLIGSTRFYYAPLGVDRIFTQPFTECRRDVGIMSSGYVSGPSAEAIEEVAVAANRVGLTVAHLGPDQPVNMTTQSKGWSSIKGVKDTELAQFYRRSKWVSGLRHVEGFELPVLEGLVCGARPIVFDRPDMRQWYDGHAVFVPETNGEELIQLLVEVMSTEPEPVSRDERQEIIKRFDWAGIAEGFWMNFREVQDGQ